MCSLVNMDIKGVLLCKISPFLFIFQRCAKRKIKIFTLLWQIAIGIEKVNLKGNEVETLDIMHKSMFFNQ